MRLRRFGLLALGGLLAWALPGQAQTFISAPFVRIAVDNGPGGGVYVRAPFVRVGDPPPVFVGPPPLLYGPNPPVVVPGPAPIVVAPPPPQPVVVTPPPKVAVIPAPVVINRPMTPQEFAQSFRPAPGPYDVVLIHPRTGQAVRVNFTLPPGNPRVYVTPRLLEFDYGSQRVSIIFGIAGGVRVRS
jgi:hypothetical protein